MTQHFNKKDSKERRLELRGNQTTAENVLWQELRSRKCLGVKFRRQYSIDHFILDFYAPRLKLAIEVDGGIHQNLDQKEYDQNRTDYLEVFGISFLRVTNKSVINSKDDVLKEIKQVIRQLSSK